MALRYRLRLFQLLESAVASASGGNLEAIAFGVNGKVLQLAVRQHLGGKLVDALGLTRATLSGDQRSCDIYTVREVIGITPQNSQKGRQNISICSCIEFQNPKSSGRCSTGARCRPIRGCIRSWPPKSGGELTGDVPLPALLLTPNLRYLHRAVVLGDGLEAGVRPKCPQRVESGHWLIAK